MVFLEGIFVFRRVSDYFDSCRNYVRKMRSLLLDYHWDSQSFLSYDLGYGRGILCQKEWIQKQYRGTVVHSKYRREFSSCKHSLASRNLYRSASLIKEDMRRKIKLLNSKLLECILVSSHSNRMRGVSIPHLNATAFRRESATEPTDKGQVSVPAGLAGLILLKNIFGISNSCHGGL